MEIYRTPQAVLGEEEEKKSYSFYKIARLINMLAALFIIVSALYQYTFAPAWVGDWKERLPFLILSLLMTSPYLLAVISYPPKSKYVWLTIVVSAAVLLWVFGGLIFIENLSFNVYSLILAVSLFSILLGNLILLIYQKAKA